jgi:hypothetical protein
MEGWTFDSATKQLECSILLLNDVLIWPSIFVGCGLVAQQNHGAAQILHDQINKIIIVW